VGSELEILTGKTRGRKPDRAFEIFERAPDGNYKKLVGVTAGKINPVPGCAGLLIDVDALWAELAGLGEPE
jgi:hypothetical protein